MTVIDLDGPAHERFGYWREVICRAFVPLAPSPVAATDTFRGRVETRPLAQVVRARVASHPQRATHGAREVARTDGEYVFVNLQTSGTCAVEQAGRRSVIRPGQLTVLDTTEPYDTVFDGPWTMTSYRIPRRLLGRRVDELRRVTGGCWDTGRGSAASVVSAVMSSMWDLDGPPGSDVEHVLASALSAAAAERAGAPADRHEALRAAIHREIEAGLFDPALSVGTVSRRLGVSPRTLHAAAGGATFAATLRRRRLEHAAAVLAEGGTQTVTEIAAGVCFDGPASFSRAFRREFGRTPSDVRRSGHVPTPRGSRPTPA